jgi:hypothetical protein
VVREPYVKFGLESEYDTVNILAKGEKKYVFDDTLINYSL